MKIAENYYSGKKIWITGHKGMLGSALVRNFEAEDVILLLASRQELDLTNQARVYDWMERNRPDLIFHVGAKVGGIYANSVSPADFLYDNLMIEANVIDAAYRFGVEKLVFVASNCTYPREVAQPIPEDALLKGELDPNIRSYAISKIAGIEMCRAYRKQHGCSFVSIIPPNLYGPGDNYHPKHSHVVAGIMRRAHEAKVANAENFIVWGDGTPRREILHVDDLANALRHIMQERDVDDLYNVGYGVDFSILELAEKIASVVGFKGNIIFDHKKPNGTLQKLLDSSKIRESGWSPIIDEMSGLKSAYADFLALLRNPTATARL